MKRRDNSWVAFCLARQVRIFGSPGRKPLNSRLGIRKNLGVPLRFLALALRKTKKLADGVGTTCGKRRSFRNQIEATTPEPTNFQPSESWRIVWLRWVANTILVATALTYSKMKTSRETFMNGQARVRLLHEPTRVGVLTGKKQLRRDRQFLQVQFVEGIRWIPEDQLEDASELRFSPLDMLEAKKLGRPIDLRRTLTHVKLSGRLADVIYSMEATNTDFHAYQFKPVVKVLESPVNGILIADEVGLGKTIEAGLIWTELRSRFDMRRLLVLCPAALREKWQRELSSKMGVTAQLNDAGQTLQILMDADASTKGFAIIASLQGLRPPRGWDDEESRKSAARLALYLRSMESEERLIDLLIIDEAHHLRNEGTQTNELGQLLKRVSEYIVLLTATPIHNRSGDLFSLLSLLDPDTFTRPDDFARILEANAPLVKARDLLLSQKVNATELRDLLGAARSNPLLRNSRQLMMIEDADISPERLARHDVRSNLAYRLETVNLLAHAVTRTRKRDVKEWRVVRYPVAHFVELEPVERRFYDLVSEVVIEYAMQCAVNERFLLAQPQRQMTSSMAASLRAWQQRLIELEESEETGEEGDDNARRSSLGPLVTEIVRRSRDYVDLGDLKRADAKYERLRQELTSFQRDNPGEKVVLFSTFRATLEYLNERLVSDGFTCIQLKGGQRETKDETILRFSDPEGPNILLSSEVGGEGVDLQFSRVVVNYDLPWNPMRLEQRIGRIDRLGQKAEKVVIWNILYANTIDARIYEKLYAKLDLCRAALGDFEAILGDEIRHLEIDLLSRGLTPEEQEQRIEQTRIALENLRVEENQLEQNAANLIAYGDYILKQVQAARDLNRWIGGEDIRSYVLDHLRARYPGCHIQQVDPSTPLVYDIGLSDSAKFDLAEFSRAARLLAMTRLASASSRPIRCRFENRVTGQPRQGEEIVSQFHPLVRMVSRQITEQGEQLTPAVALTLKRSPGILLPEPGVYVLAAARWAFQGLQEIERLSFAATTIDHQQLLSIDMAERLAGAAVALGQDWPEAPIVVDLECAHRVAKDVLLGALYDDFESVTREISARNEDRASIQLATLEEHLRQQTGKLEETLGRHRTFKRDSLVKATEGRLQALQSRVNQQKLKIEARRRVKSDSQEIAVAIIQVS
ncbi:MAG: DEAD/DEAH box helicase [Planctomycetes bacterium]|nr:DEAD/DEAH box helicase [Planctomycetota bacterium]